MRVDPADSATVQVITADKLNYLLVTHVCNSVHQPVGFEHCGPSLFISNQQFTVDQIVAGGFFAIQQAIQFPRVRVPVRKEANPNRGVDQYHLGRSGFCGGYWPAPRNISCVPFGATQFSEPFISCASN